MVTYKDLLTLSEYHFQQDKKGYLDAYHTIIEKEKESGKVNVAREMTLLSNRYKTGGMVPINSQSKYISYYDVSDIDETKLVESLSMQESFHQVVEEYKKLDLLREHGLTPVTTMLMVGPPGTGKTLGASILAKRMGLELGKVNIESVIESYLGKTSRNLTELFAEMENRPALYFFDEIDSIGSDRKLGDVGETRRYLNTLLERMDGVLGKGVYILGATNYPELLDRALYRRFGIHLHTTLPSREELGQLVDNLLGEKYLGKLGYAVKREQLVTVGDGFSHSVFTEHLNQHKKRGILEGILPINISQLLTSMEDYRTTMDRTLELKRETEQMAIKKLR